MKLPDGYLVERVLSAGPTTIVALAQGPGGACVLKGAAIGRGVGAIEREAGALRALEGVAGVPRLLETWDGGLALERLAMPTLRASGAALGESRGAWGRAARRAFERLADVHDVRDPGGAPLELVHGDLSPDNVYASLDGSEVALADFGLARWRGSAPLDAETAGAFRGTLAYAAPEVARGEAFDGRADDFALAASLLQVATGVALHPPLAGSATPEAVLLVEAGTRALDASHPWRSLAPALFDPPVAEALLACLAFDPRDRPRRTPRPC